MPKVIGIDLCPHRPAVIDQERPNDADLHYVVGDSSSDSVIRRTYEILGGPPDAVFIDADHSYAKSAMDYRAWWPHARLLLAFHDILMDHRDSVGTLWNDLKHGT